MMMRLFRSDDKFSQMLNQYESSPEFGNASGSGGCGDDEPGGDEDGDEDEEDGDIVMYLDRVYIGLYRSIGKVARESIPDELSPSTYPGRHVARDWYLHIEREKCL
ncbi:hypothetical protein Tco_0715846 [Tanacetum coccineum]